MVEIRKILSKPDPEVIAQAEDLLRRCKSGEVRHFSGIALGGEATHHTYHVGKANNFRIIGALERLKGLYVAESIETEDDN